MIILLAIIAVCLIFLVVNSVIDTAIGGVAVVVLIAAGVIKIISDTRKEADKSGKKPNEQLEKNDDLHINYM